MWISISKRDAAALKKHLAKSCDSLALARIHDRLDGLLYAAAAKPRSSKSSISSISSQERPRALKNWRR